MSHLRGKKIPFSLKSQNQKQRNTVILIQFSKILIRIHLNFISERDESEERMINQVLQHSRTNRTSALADSGASINLLPHSIYKKLGLEALTPTRMTLELANRSIITPYRHSSEDVCSKS
ncbi:reverse transcriptase domain-containing protein [Tanacetum coccineum]